MMSLILRRMNHSSFYHISRMMKMMMHMISIVMRQRGSICHGMPHPPCPHAPDRLQSSPTLSAYTLVSLQCTLCKLAQPHHSCHWTKLRSMSNFPRLGPYVSGCCLFVFFSICRICLMHFH